MGCKRPKFLTGNGIYLCTQAYAIAPKARYTGLYPMFLLKMNTFDEFIVVKRIEIKKITYVVDF
jgi:hypothetical protein